jgi:hypothetical protein
MLSHGDTRHRSTSLGIPHYLLSSHGDTKHPHRSRWIPSIRFSVERPAVLSHCDTRHLSTSLSIPPPSPIVPRWYKAPLTMAKWHTTSVDFLQSRDETGSNTDRYQWHCNMSHILYYIPYIFESQNRIRIIRILISISYIYYKSNFESSDSDTVGN